MSRKCPNEQFRFKNGVPFQLGELENKRNSQFSSNFQVCLFNFFRLRVFLFFFRMFLNSIELFLSKITFETGPMLFTLVFICLWSSILLALSMSSPLALALLLCDSSSHFTYFWSSHLRFAGFSFVWPFLRFFGSRSTSFWFFWLEPKTSFLNKFEVPSRKKQPFNLKWE